MKKKQKLELAKEQQCVYIDMYKICIYYVQMYIFVHMYSIYTYLSIYTYIYILCNYKNYVNLYKIISWTIRIIKAV